MFRPCRSFYTSGIASYNAVEGLGRSLAGRAKARERIGFVVVGMGDMRFDVTDALESAEDGDVA